MSFIAIEITTRYIFAKLITIIVAIVKIVKVKQSGLMQPYSSSSVTTIDLIMEEQVQAMLLVFMELLVIIAIIEITRVISFNHINHEYN